MAAGRPVVFTERNGAAEILAGSGAGVAVLPDDPAALAAALRPYLADPGAAAAAGDAGRRLVAERCDPQRIAEQREAVVRTGC